MTLLRAALGALLLAVVVSALPAFSARQPLVSAAQAQDALDTLLLDAAAAIVAGDDVRALEALRRAGGRADADAATLVALARLELRRGDLRAADDTLRRLLASAPEHATALALRGDVLRAAGRLDEAGASYARALASDPSEATALAGTARISLAAGDRTAAAALDVPFDPNSLALRLAWADAEADAGDLEAAIVELDTLLANSPGYVPALVRRGDFHRRRGRMAEAQFDLERAVRQDQLSAEARFRRGLLRRDLSDLASALDDFNRAIGLDPDFAPAYLARGALYQAAGKQAAAIRDFEIALQVDPANVDAQAHRAVSECARGAFDRCLVAAEAALHHGDDDWRAHVARGHALLGRNEPDLAVVAYGRAIARAPQAEQQWLLARLQKHLRPRLQASGGFGWSWQFLAARDTGQVERLMRERAKDP